MPTLAKRESAPAVATASDVSKLAISRFTHVVAGSTVKYTVEVTNRGAAGTVGSSDLHLYYDRPDPPMHAEAGSQIQMLPPMRSGTTRTLFFERLNTPAGTYRSWARCDIRGQVADPGDRGKAAGPVVVTVR